jgi:hypothetical protein
MALLTNADLMDLAIKQKLIGATFYMGDDTTKVIDDYEFSMATNQVCLKFADGDQKFFNFIEKFKVDTVQTVTRINTGKVKLHKK